MCSIDHIKISAFSVIMKSLLNLIGMQAHHNAPLWNLTDREKRIKGDKRSYRRFGGHGDLSVDGSWETIDCRNDS